MGEAKLLWPDLVQESMDEVRLKGVTLSISYEGYDEV